MNNILIVNFKRLGDIYSSGHLINAIKTQHPHCKIGLVVFKEFESAAKNLKNVEHVYSYSRKRASTLLKNKIFNKAKALEELHLFAHEVISGNWTGIFNMSNDTFGTNFCSYLKEIEPRANILGTSINTDKGVLFSNEFATIFNDVITNRENSPLHFQDCYHSIIGVSPKPGGNNLKTNQGHEDVAKDQIEKLKSSSGTRTKVVAIQLKTSTKSKELPYLTMRNLIAHIKEDESLFPLILFAPLDEERALAKRINKEFGGTLVTVEADLTAIASVLKNCDLLVTPDTVIKHIADQVGTKVLEISLGPSPFLKQGTISVNGLIITDRINDRNFKVNPLRADIITTRIKAKDVYEAIKFSFDPSYTIQLDSGISIYKSSRDALGTRFDIVGGDIPWMHEIDRQASRFYIAGAAKSMALPDLMIQLNKFPTKTKKEWAQKQKERAAEISKDLLSTLRILAKLKNSPAAGHEFITHLDRLLSHCAKDDLLSCPVLFFRARVENIQANSRDESVKITEQLLYELKAHVQKAFEVIKEVESETGRIKDEETVITNGYNL